MDLHEHSKRHELQFLSCRHHVQRHEDYVVTCHEPVMTGHDRSLLSYQKVSVAQRYSKMTCMACHDQIYLPGLALTRHSDLAPSHPQRVVRSELGDERLGMGLELEFELEIHLARARLTIPPWRSRGLALVLPSNVGRYQCPATGHDSSCTTSQAPKKYLGLAPSHDCREVFAMTALVPS